MDFLKGPLMSGWHVPNAGPFASCPCSPGLSTDLKENCGLVRLYAQPCLLDSNSKWSGRLQEEPGLGSVFITSTLYSTGLWVKEAKCRD